MNQIFSYFFPNLSRHLKHDNLLAYFIYDAELEFFLSAGLPG
jgi:hypothetical protein